MKRKYFSGLLAVALFLTMLAGVSYANMASSSENAQEVDDKVDFYDVYLDWEGDYFTQAGTISFVGDRDAYNLHLSTTLKVTVIVADCCIMGDTIAIYYPWWVLYSKTTSPNILKGTATLGPGTYSFDVGYEACPGGYPAGYYIWVIATHG